MYLCGKIYFLKPHRYIGFYQWFILIRPLIGITFQRCYENYFRYKY